ncbi:DUF91 domain-containing protein [candidate division KSB1 bacterium]|nr:DUF91 domain-containing protein [candidate division KSB1 bacterium]
MEKCPVCENTKLESTLECHCGYSLIENKIKDDLKLRAFYLKLQRENWVKEVSLLLKIHQTQEKKHGVAVSGKKGGWTYKDTGKLLGKRKSLIAEDIDLALSIVRYPHLLKCRNKTQAKQRLKQIVKNTILPPELYNQFDDESELQKHIIDNWERTPFFKKWSFEDSSHHLSGAGELDILARHHDNGNWLVIELKKKVATDKTVGQIHRYIGWVKENLARNNEEVFGCIVTGYPPDENLRLALLNTKNVEQQIYFLDDDQIKFVNEQDAFSFLKLDKLPPEKQKDYFEILKHKNESADPKES